MDGDPTTSLGSLCQCSVPHPIQKDFLVLRRKLLCSPLCPVPPVFSLGATEKSRTLSLQIHICTDPPEPSLLSRQLCLCLPQLPRRSLSFTLSRLCSFSMCFPGHKTCDLASLNLHSACPLCTGSPASLPERIPDRCLSSQVLPSSRLLPRPDATVLTLQPLEGVRPGSVIGSVAPPDAPTRGQLTYTVVGGGGDGTFVVDSVTGEIYAARELDYEARARHTLQVSAEDTQHGYPSSRLVLVQILVQDCNDQAPTFPEDPITIVVPENAQAGSSVFTFQALDGDGVGPNSQVRYALLRQEPPGAPFHLDSRSGLLSLHQSLDREAVASFLLVVEATDQARNVSQRRSSAVTARVFVTDVNDNAPVFLSPAAVSVTEDRPTGFVALHVVAQDNDLGENGRVSYSLRAGNGDGRFHLNPSTGESLGRVQGDTGSMGPGQGAGTRGGVVRCTGERGLESSGQLEVRRTCGAHTQLG